jgi:ParB-like chromosome segregation protein Spo0J
VLPLNKLVPNTGQIADVPKNPRLIRDERFKQLCKSLQEDDLTGVEPCKVVPFGDKFVVLGGNMRYRALKEIGAKDVSCIVVPDGTPAKVLRKIVQIDNSQFGEYD